MKNRKTYPLSDRKIAEKPVERSEERNPELIEKFYKQIINSFGYAYPGKV